MDGKRVIWADRDIGANSPQDAGYYIAWGAPEIAYTNFTNGNFTFYTSRPESYGGSGWGSTATYQAFNKNCAPYCDGNIFTKYNKTDNKKALEPEDDIVVRNWRNGWTTPTLAQCQALAAQCVWVVNKSGSNILGHYIYKAKDESHKGYIKNGNGSNNKWDSSNRHYTSFGRDISNQYDPSVDICIYLPYVKPAAGSNNTGNYNYSLYWTATIHSADEGAYGMIINATCANIGSPQTPDSGREFGGMVRPVFVVSE